MHAPMKFFSKREPIKPFAERNPVVLGVVGAVVLAALVIGAVQFRGILDLARGTTYSAFFADAGGLKTGEAVQVAGYKVGQVKSITLVDSHALVTFDIKGDIRVGDRSEAAIKTKALLGSKVLEVIPRGEGTQNGTIPMERTTSPYQLPDALGDLSATISGLNTNQLSDSLTVLSQTFADTPPQLQAAVAGVARFSQTLDQRDAELRSLLSNANKATGILAQRSDEIVSLVSNTNALLVQLESQSSALDQLAGNFAALSTQLRGLIADNRTSQACAGPAQRRVGHHRQPQGQDPGSAQGAARLLDLARRGRFLGPVLQGLPLQPVARSVRSAVHRRGVL